MIQIIFNININIIFTLSILFRINESKRSKKIEIISNYQNNLSISYNYNNLFFKINNTFKLS